MRRILTKILSFCLLFVRCHAQTERPNIVLIFADDIGISAIDCYGSEEGTGTPEVDRLARDGIRFEYGFSHPICGPSRVCLMTGLYPFRTGGLGNPDSQRVNPETFIPFSKRLHDAGYATFATGKWPWLGHMENMEAWGFDHMVTWRNYGTKDRYWNPTLYIDGEKKTFPGEYGPDIMQDAIFNFIDSVKATNPDKPFFVYYPTPLPHGPMEKTPDSPPGEQSNRQKSDDMVRYLDKQVGDLRRRLESRGFGENTIIFFLGDNGSLQGFEEQIRGGTILGGKGWITDGGCRVPWIVYWPKVIQGGRVTDELVDLSDFYPSLLEVAGVPMPTDQSYDGQSFMPILRGDEEYRGRDWVFYQFGQPGFNQFAVRAKNWKIDHNGRFYDLTDSLHKEVLVEVSPGMDPAARKAYDRLKAVMDDLDPPAGVTPAPARHGGQLTGVTYTSSIESSVPHVDRSPPTLLLDAQWRSPGSDSVQYNGDPVITFELIKPRVVTSVTVMAFNRGGYRLRDVTVEYSENGEQWETAPRQWERIAAQETIKEPPAKLEFAVGEPVKFFRVSAFRAEGARRVLLSEVVIK